jgi:hypothetical protein
MKPLIAVLPSLWRFIQCVQRYKTENYDQTQLWNAGKYPTLSHRSYWRFNGFVVVPSADVTTTIEFPIRCRILEPYSEDIAWVYW